MGAFSDAAMISMSSVGFMSSGLYVVVQCIEIRAAGGVRSWLRTEVRKVQDAERAVEQEVDQVVDVAE